MLKKEPQNTNHSLVILPVLKSTLVVFIAGIWALQLTHCESQPKSDQNQLNIAVAANMEFTMEALRDSFLVNNQAIINLIVGSSGKLTSQIIQGAPYDILLAANLKFPEKLVKSGMAIGPILTYAQGSLVLWTQKSIDLSAGPSVLIASTVKRIAIANPVTAPYGQAADQYLDNCGFAEVRNKLVYGENISQAIQFVHSESCDLGIVSKSAVMAPILRDQGTWIDLDPSCYETIEQAAIVTLYGVNHHSHLSQEFMKFLFSEQAKEVLQKFGYTIPENSL